MPIISEPLDSIDSIGIPTRIYETTIPIEPIPTDTLTLVSPDNLCIGDRVVTGIYDEPWYTGFIVSRDNYRIYIERDDGVSGAGPDGTWQCSRNEFGEYGSDGTDGHLYYLDNQRAPDKKKKRKLVRLTTENAVQNAFITSHPRAKVDFRGYLHIREDNPIWSRFNYAAEPLRKEQQSTSVHLSNLKINGKNLVLKRYRKPSQPMYIDLLSIPKYRKYPCLKCGERQAKFIKGLCPTCNSIAF